MNKYSSFIVSEDKKAQILQEYPSIIEKLKLHRERHKKFVSSQTINLDKPAWVRVNPGPNMNGNGNSYRLCLGFKNIGCTYRDKDEKKLGCLNCGYYANTAFKEVDDNTIIKQFKEAISVGRETKTFFDSIEFLNDGSFFNKEEISQNLQIALFRLISEMPEIKRVLVESRPEFIDQNSVSRLISVLRDDQILEIGIGIESADDFIREVCINKGYSKKDFEDVIKSLSCIKFKNKKLFIVTYLLVKPAFINDKESIDDIICSINYLRLLSEKYGIKITPKLEPAAIVDGTILSLLHLDKKNSHYYEPLSYWSILEILARLATNNDLAPILNILRIGAREDMDDIIKAPAIYSREGDIYYPFDFVIYESIQKFNQHHDIYRLFSMVTEVYERSNSFSICNDNSLKNWMIVNKIDESSIIKFISGEENIQKIKKWNKKADSEIDFVMMIYSVLDIMEGYNTEQSIVKKEIDNAVLLNSKTKIEEGIYSCFMKLFVNASVVINVNTFETKDGVAEVFFDVKNIANDSIISIWSKFLITING